jgi:protein-tyrosine phosphatase
MLKEMAERIAAHYGSKKGMLRHWLSHPGWRRYRWAVRPSDEVAIDRLVFICQGNICRSALAAAAAEQYGIPTASFGLDTCDGKPAAPGMIAAAKACGFDLTEHRATRIEHYRPAKGDLVCLMEPGHLPAFSRQCAGHPTLTLLGLWQPVPMSYIHDPLCCGPAYFATCTRRLIAAVENLAARSRAGIAATTAGEVTTG